jgi:RimJ/RimL family protein N-acetyltransferase
LRVVAYNTRAIRCYLACGFVVEGRMRKSARSANHGALVQFKFKLAQHPLRQWVNLNVADKFRSGPADILGA